MVRNHNGERNYDLIETENMKTESSLGVIFTTKINFQELNFVV